MIPITENLAIPVEELDWSFVRAGGPGGQNVNKVASKAVLRWNLAQNQTIPVRARQRLSQIHPGKITADGVMIITSSEFRDQERNRERCREKLAEWVREALVEPTPRKKTRPTASSKRRRVADKRRIANVNRIGVGTGAKAIKSCRR